MKQKFDPFVWNEAKINAKVPHPKGHLRLRLSQPAPLYIEVEGVEALAGYSADFDLEVSEAVTFRVEGAKPLRAFVYAPLSTSTVADGEVYTNIDRKPHESGMLAEVTKARRMLEIEKRQMLADIRREASIARNSVKAKGADPAPAEIPQDEPPADESEGSE